jgi:hypothetical protein
MYCWNWARGRRGAAAVEAADRHHRVSGGQLVAGRVVGPDGGGDPGVVAGVVLEQGHHLGAGAAAVEQAADGARLPAAEGAAGEPALGLAAAEEPAPASRTRGSRARAASARIALKPHWASLNPVPSVAPSSRL